MNEQCGTCQTRPGVYVTLGPKGRKALICGECRERAYPASPVYKRPRLASRVRYIGATDEQVQWRNNSDPRRILVEGAVYDVADRREYDHHTDLYLKGFPGYKFNSACFEVVEVAA